MWAEAYMPEYTDSQSNRAIIIDILWIEVIEKITSLSAAEKPAVFGLAQKNQIRTVTVIIALYPCNVRTFLLKGRRTWTWMQDFLAVGPQC